MPAPQNHARIRFHYDWIQNLVLALVRRTHQNPVPTREERGTHTKATQESKQHGIRLKPSRGNKPALKRKEFFIPKSVKIQKVTGAKASEPSSRNAQDLSKRRVQTDLRKTAEDLGKGTQTKRG